MIFYLALFDFNSRMWAHYKLFNVLKRQHSSFANRVIQMHP